MLRRTEKLGLIIMGLGALAVISGSTEIPDKAALVILIGAVFYIWNGGE